MKHSYPFIAILFYLFTCGALSAQVVTMQPVFATAQDTVTITFNAALGNGELAGEADVWAHTGVITNLSTSPTGWRHVQGNWGTPDNKVKMTALGNNLHQISYHIPTFYNVPASETVLRLAFVFRNVDGSKVGRNTDGSDIFLEIYQGGYVARIASPAEKNLLVSLQDTLTLLGEVSQASDVAFFVDGVQVAQATNALDLTYQLPVANFGAGNRTVTFRADQGGQTAWDTLLYLARSTTPVAALPAGREEGLHTIDPQTMYFQLRAPGKAYSYLIGDFNDWQFSADYEMALSPDSNFFWIEITGLNPGQEYRFQYYVGEEGIRIADAYCEKILDPWNDPFIPATTYPNLLPYPTGKTNFPVGVFNTAPVAYNWDTSYDYQRPDKDQLVVYELLIRDFDDRRTYQSVIDRLPYLDSLGINAIELLPVMEFEGNESWGYNPMFFFAPDKYYGPANDLKMLIDSCHRRGIAVILDIALNHAFGQNPMVRLYFDPQAGDFGQPTPESPWFNPVPKHDFNVGYDFNHESPATRYFSKRVIAHWVEAYKIDGYRFDLSKGFTQRNTLGNIGAWNAFDQSRVDIWEDYRDHLWAIDSNLYLILEHFADNSEERVLSDMGFMLWGNANHEYNEATMAFSSNLSVAGHTNRGWNDMNLVGYKESHDEERLQFKNNRFGRVTSGYNVRDAEIGLARIEAAANILYAIPGPKMLWQFGEMGYDYSINHCPDGTIQEGCRTSNKPIRWDYMTEPARVQLFGAFQRMIRLHTQHPILKSPVYEMNAHPFLKRVTVTGDSATYLIALANFDFRDGLISPNWPLTGTWYEYHSGDSLEVENLTDEIFLLKGAYRLYTNFKIELNPDTTTSTDPGEDPIEPGNFTRVGPNPFSDAVLFRLGTLSTDQAVINIYNTQGQIIWRRVINALNNEVRTIEWPGTTTSGSPVGDGIYYYEIQRRNENIKGKLVKVTP